MADRKQLRSLYFDATCFIFKLVFDCMIIVVETVDNFSRDLTDLFYSVTNSRGSKVVNIASPTLFALIMLISIFPVKDKDGQSWSYPR